MMRQRLYNPAQLAPDELRASFIARQETLEELLRVIRQEKSCRPCQHFLLIGPRGMGKTTLGLRFLLSIEDDPELASRWKAVAFDEESYGIGDLADFWLTALHHLARSADDRQWADRADALREDESDPERQAVYARAALRDYCQESGKRLVLFVENLDVIFGQLGRERDVHALRASLIERSDILLVGSANTVFDAIRGHGEPFYEFFRLFILEGLGREDTRRMLASFADGDGNSKLPEALHRERSRLETVRRLTGGNPRLLVLACRMLIESPLGSPLEDLQRLIDEQTPYFKARIEELPVQGRRVFHCLAAGWTPMLAKEVAVASKLSSSHASAQLRQLVEKGYAREIKLRSEKRVRYEIVDRFYNIYHLLRFSRTSRQRLERLVHFLHDLFGSTGIRAMYPAALNALRAQEPSAKETSDWLGILAGYVARDEEFSGREEWRRSAVALIDQALGTNAPVLGEIEQAFTHLHPTEPLELPDKLRRGAELIQSERFKDAEAVYRQVVQLAPDNHVGWLFLGLVLFLQDKLDDAADVLDRVVECVRPDDSEGLRIGAVAALALKTYVFIHLEQFEAALPDLSLISDYVSPRDPPALREIGAKMLLLTGRARAGQRQHEAALVAWERAAECARPEDPEELRHTSAKALAARGQALAELERSDEALAALQGVTKLLHAEDSEEPRHTAAEALRTRGDVLAKLDRNEEALAEWERVGVYVRAEDPAELRRTAAFALLSSGNRLLELEQFDDSVSVVRRASEYVESEDAIEVRRPVAIVLAAGSGLLHADGRHGESEALCRKAVALYPKHVRSWDILAKTILGQNDSSRLEEAEDCARRALQLEPENANTLHTLSQVLIRRGRTKEGLELLERAIALEDTDFQTRDWPSLAITLIEIAAAGYGGRVKSLMEKAELVERMEPLWHAVRGVLGEDLEPLPAEIMDAVMEIRRQLTEKR